MMEDPLRLSPKTSEQERLSALGQLEAWLHVPMMVLSFVWLVLVIVELTMGNSRLLEVFGTAIWIVFLAEFMIRLAVAPERLSFLKSNWLSIIALARPPSVSSACSAFFVSRAPRGACVWFGSSAPQTGA